MKRCAQFAALVLLSACCAIPANAILNCFSPNAFKMKAPSAYGANAERANWYPQTAQTSGYGQPPIPAYPQSPMKNLFQSKWKPSLFGVGTKMAWPSWKMGAGLGYRPSFGGAGGTGLYGASLFGGANVGPQMPGYPLPSELNIAPLTLPASAIDGWSAPVNAYTPMQAQLTGFDSPGYSQQYDGSQQSSQQLLPLGPSRPTGLDPYFQQQQQQQLQPMYQPPQGEGTKTPPARPTQQQQQQQQQTTTKKFYDYFVAGAGEHIANDYDYSINNNNIKGYSYPNWYSGTIDSPARVVQQLKHNLRLQRLQQQQQQQLQKHNFHNKQQLGHLNLSSSTFGEPHFDGYGSVESVSNREARLTCSFRELIDKSDRPLWVKFIGAYNVSKPIVERSSPPFNCPNNLCRTQEIDTSKDYRYRFENGPTTTTLVLAEPRLDDYGVYRCSAISQSANNNNKLETIYQIVKFGN